MRGEDLGLTAHRGHGNQWSRGLAVFVDPRVVLQIKKLASLSV